MFRLLPVILIFVAPRPAWAVDSERHREPLALHSDANRPVDAVVCPEGLLRFLDRFTGWDAAPVVPLGSPLRLRVHPLVFSRFSDDGLMLVTIDSEGRIRVLESSGRLLAEEVSPHSKIVTEVIFSAGHVTLIRPIGRAIRIPFSRD